MRHHEHASKGGEGFTKDLDMRVAENIRQDQSYVELLTGRYGYVNGPMVDYLRHRREVPATIRLTQSPYDIEGLPELSFPKKIRGIESIWERTILEFSPPPPFCFGSKPTVPGLISSTTHFYVSRFRLQIQA